MSKKAMRLPNPDLITPLETKNAAKINNIKLSEKPENAVSTGSTWRRTTATNAITDAVKMDIASSKTARIAVMKMANKCQASGDKSQGIGRFQMMNPNARVSTLLSQRTFWLLRAGASNLVELINVFFHYLVSCKSRFILIPD